LANDRFAPEAADQKLPLGRDQRSGRFCRYGLRLAIERRGGRDGGGTVCHAYAAIGVPGLSRKFGGPDLQGDAFQFGDKFIDDRITDLRQFETSDPRRSCQ
jgi:hypothetical protein